MSNWRDLGRTLYATEIRDVIRDACAYLGKCNDDDLAEEVLAKTPEELHLDDPPLRDRPDHQKVALVYLIVSLLHDANILLLPSELPREYFIKNPNKPLEVLVNQIGNAQAYPADAI